VLKIKKLSELAWQGSRRLSEKNILSPNGRNFGWKAKENVSSLMTNLPKASECISSKN